MNGIICEDIGGPNRRCIPIVSRAEGCQATHTPQPKGYTAWHEWAEEMDKTHDQSQCPYCGKWAVWTKRPTP